MNELNGQMLWSDHGSWTSAPLVPSVMPLTPPPFQRSSSYISPAAGFSGAANQTPQNLSSQTGEPCKPFPTHIPGDYAKIIYLLILFVLGGTVNIFAYSVLSKQEMMQARNQHTVTSAGNVVLQLHQLKQHLNAGNMMVIFVHCLSDLLWHIFYEWHGGVGLCKLVQFGRVFAYYLSSNVIVCIAMNRYFTVFPLKAVNPNVRVQIMVAAAWIFALGCSLPQFWFWTTIELCVNIWDLIETTDNRQFTSAQRSQATYALAHLLAVFFIPLGIIMSCYGLLICRIPRTCNCPSSTMPQSPSYTYTATTTNNVHTTICTPVSRSVDDHMNVRIPLRPTLSIQPHSTLAKQSVVSYSEQQYVNSTPINLTEGYRLARNKAITISLLLIISYIGCFLPYNVLQLSKVIAGHSTYAQNYWLQAFDNLNVLMILNSVVNPFIYGVFVSAVPPCTFVSASTPLPDGRGIP